MSEPCNFVLGVPRSGKHDSLSASGPRGRRSTRRRDRTICSGNSDWDWIDGEIAPLYSERSRLGIETRFVIELLLLKHIYGLTDEGVCERWVYNPYIIISHLRGMTQSGDPEFVGLLRAYRVVRRHITASTKHKERHKNTHTCAEEIQRYPTLRPLRTSRPNGFYSYTDGCMKSKVLSERLVYLPVAT